MRCTVCIYIVAVRRRWVFFCFLFCIMSSFFFIYFFTEIIIIILYTYTHAHAYTYTCSWSARRRRGLGNVCMFDAPTYYILSYLYYNYIVSRVRPRSVQRRRYDSVAAPQLRIGSLVNTFIRYV
jgi:hypothetical protein